MPLIARLQLKLSAGLRKNDIVNSTRIFDCRFH